MKSWLCDIVDLVLARRDVSLVSGGACRSAAAEWRAALFERRSVRALVQQLLHLHYMRRPAPYREERWEPFPGRAVSVGFALACLGAERWEIRKVAVLLSCAAGQCNAGGSLGGKHLYAICHSASLDGSRR